MIRHPGPEQRTRFAAGLRALAEFIESHPDVPTPWSADVLVFPLGSNDAEKCAEIDAIADRIGAVIDDHTADYGHYTASRYFGPVEYRAVAIPARSREYHDAQQSYTPNVVPDTVEEV